MREEINKLAPTACAPAADLMRPTEAEPALPEPRDAITGYTLDELVVQLEAVAEWGSRGWHRVLDWQERERRLGPCVRQEATK